MTKNVFVIIAAIGGTCAVAVVASLLAAQSRPAGPVIHVDQAGYLPDAPKIAILVANWSRHASLEADAKGARVARSGSSEVITVPLGGARLDQQTNDTVRTIDLSTVTQPGTYVISIEGTGASDPIHVQPDVYRLPLYLTARAFYGLRCGTPVDLGPKFPTYRHAACHLEDATFHESSGRSGRRQATKGWHDAGDYGKYIVNSGISTGQLLWAWEWYPDVFRKLRLDIPESTNAIPDLLDEARWNLEWMLSMQDEDGGVWHKLTSAKFGSFKMPEQDDGVPRYVIGTGIAPFKSTCATADFAAVMAIAARNWLDFDRSFATTTLDAARRAWTWVTRHPEIRFRNPAGVVTGEYGDANCADERLWAAAELLRTTGDAEYDTAARSLAASFTVRPLPPESWANVGTLGLWSYAFADRGDPTLQTRIRTETIDLARQVAKRTLEAGWRHGLTVEDFQWGSNGAVANYGVLLLVASRLSPEPEFREAALDNLHYLLGRNTFGLSWLTGVGVRPYRHPHHRPSGADENAVPWPGLLSGGPNRNGGDPVLDKLPAWPPGRRYEDDQASYAGNEIAINWQAPLVFLLAGVQP